MRFIEGALGLLAMFLSSAMLVVLIAAASHACHGRAPCPRQPSATATSSPTTSSTDRNCEIRR